MTAIISGKIVNAWKVNPNAWLFKLKPFLSSFGTSPVNWEIYGGNAFVIKITHPEESLFIAIIIKSIFRQIAELDIDITIGIGTFTANNSLRASEGTALIHSKWNEGESIPKKANFVIRSHNQDFDNNFNLLFQFALINMNEWSFAEAEVVELCMLFPEKSQQELAEWLRIKQSAISQRKARAQLDLLLKLDQYFKTAIKQFNNE